MTHRTPPPPLEDGESRNYLYRRVHYKVTRKNNTYSVRLWWNGLQEDFPLFDSNEAASRAAASRIDEFVGAWVTSLQERARGHQ